MLATNNQRVFVISYLEIVGLFVIFSSILYILYSNNDMIEEKVLSETSNYDLTAAYLENLLQHDQKNESLILALAKNVKKSGNFYLSIKLLDTLKNTKSSDMRQEIQDLKYYILKDSLNHLDKEEKIKTQDQMKLLIKQIQLRKYQTINDIKQWYSESIWIRDYIGAMVLAKKALKMNEKDIYWLEQCYMLGIELKEKDIVNMSLDGLLRYDLDNEEKWLTALYYQAYNDKEYEKAVAFLVKLKKFSSTWKAEHANLALAMKQYRKASALYMELSQNSKQSYLKKKWLLKSVESLQYGNLMNEATALAQRHEEWYLDDREIMNKWIKLYLNANDLEAASKLSNKLLELKKEE